MTAVNKRNGVNRGGLGDAAETPNDAAFGLRAWRNELSNVICAAMGDGRGKGVGAIFGSHQIVAAVIQ